MLLLTRGHLFWGAVIAVIYVAAIKSLEEAGIKLNNRISAADTGAKAEQAVAEALQELPDDYYVFHDLEFPGFNIDHVVLSPNGIFRVETKSQMENITQEHDVLLRNGQPSLMATWCSAAPGSRPRPRPSPSGSTLRTAPCHSRPK